MKKRKSTKGKPRHVATYEEGLQAGVNFANAMRAVLRSGHKPLKSLPKKGRAA